MATEDLTGTGKFIDDLVVTNPVSSDLVSSGDEHLRGVKNVLKNSFGAVTGAVTATHTELNFVDGVTSAIQTQIDAALPKSGGAMTGAITTNSTFDGVDVAARDAILTSTTTTAGAALPKTGGTMTGGLVLPAGSASTGGVNLPAVNSWITGGGHGVVQVDSTSTYLYGGTNGIRFRAADNSSEIAAVDNSGNITVSGTCTATAFSGDGSSLSGVQPFPSGTKMLFQQTSAPTSWTKSTSHNDKALRVVSGSVSSGGTHGLSSPPSTAHTHTGPSHTHTGAAHTHAGPTHTHLSAAHSHGHSLSAGAHTLSTSQMPSHNHISPIGHNFQYSSPWGSSGTLSSGQQELPPNGAEGGEGRPLTSSTGSGSSHSHSMSGSVSSTTPGATGTASGTTGSSTPGTGSASGTGATGSTAPTAFAPLYLDVIVATKD